MKTTTIIKLLVGTLAAALLSTTGGAADITLNVAPAVQVTWPTTTNHAYQVLDSTNLTGPYIATGQLIEGTGGNFGAFLTATNSQRFYRVLETPSSGITWLEGVWEGLAYQSVRNAATFTVHISITNSNR